MQKKRLGGEHLRARVATTSAVVAATLALGGCAHSYVDAQGNRHVIGLVHVTLPPSAPTAAESIQSRAIGLLLTQAEIGTALSFGFSESTLTFIRADSCANLAFIAPGRAPEQPRRLP